MEVFFQSGIYFVKYAIICRSNTQIFKSDGGWAEWNIMKSLRENENKYYIEMPKLFGHWKQMENDHARMNQKLLKEEWTDQFKKWF